MYENRRITLFQALPNVITIGRLILAPFVIIAIVDDSWRLAFALFVAAGLSDGLDGYLAKKYHLCTKLGAFLDPLADKALLIALYVTLGIGRDIAPALAVIVVARDALIMSGVLAAWLSGRPIAIKPHVISKANTAAQITFAALALGSKAFGVSLGLLYDAGTYLVGALTLASMASYFAPWMRHMTGERPR